MIDTHAHIHDQQFNNDRAEVLQRAAKNEVKAIITIGTSLQESIRAVEMAKKSTLSGIDEIHKSKSITIPQIFSAIGIHPHVYSNNDYLTAEKKAMLADEQEQIAQLSQDPYVIAIGEVGLDYYTRDTQGIHTEDKKRQWEGLLWHLSLAHTRALPSIIHCRNSTTAQDAHEDLFSILRDFPTLPIILHCHSGNIATTEKFLTRPQTFISFAGNVTYSRPHSETYTTQKSIVSMIPNDRLLIETDCPYLAPIPHRGKRNEPSFLPAIITAIATFRNQSPEEIVKITQENTKRIFNI